MTSNDWEQVRQAFKRIWGYDDFRPPQAEVVRTLIGGQDALIVMPTGGGKSICFQLPALLQSGLTLVVSPLVALMENQVQELKSRRLPAARLHSQLSSTQRRQTLKAVIGGQLKLLYLSPETLLSKPLWQTITQPQVKINGIILDEAHTLYEWQDTFRPAYNRLGAVRQALCQNQSIPLAAFTATAAPEAQKTIIKTLQLHQPQQILISPYRSHLQLRVKTVWTKRKRLQQLIQFINSYRGKTGLVYVCTRQDSAELAGKLNSLGYPTAAYHGGLDGSKRREIEAAWLQGKLAFVVCTSAFGMGINKSDVRWVAHWQAPLLLSEYIQQVGRAGRDGQSAEALTLVGEPTGWLYPDDVQRRKYFLQQMQQQGEKLFKIAQSIPVSGSLESISGESQTSLSLAWLHGAGCLEWLSPFHYRLSKSVTSNHLQHRFQQYQNLVRQMRNYLYTRECRWSYLLIAFGFEESLGFRCGKCDNCLG